MDARSEHDISGKKITDITINEALETLTHAAKEKKEDMENLLKTKYSNLKTLIIQGQETTSRAVKDGTEAVKEMAENVDKKIKERPWPFVIGALIAGFIVGRKK